MNHEFLDVTRLEGQMKHYRLICPLFEHNKNEFVVRQGVQLVKRAVGKQLTHTLNANLFHPILNLNSDRSGGVHPSTRVIILAERQATTIIEIGSSEKKESYNNTTRTNELP
jgi:hypothetical protein